MKINTSFPLLWYNPNKCSEVAMVTRRYSIRKENSGIVYIFYSVVLSGHCDANGIYTSGKNTPGAGEWRLCHRDKHSPVQG